MEPPNNPNPEPAPQAEPFACPECSSTINPATRELVRSSNLATRDRELTEKVRTLEEQLRVSDEAQAACAARIRVLEDSIRVPAIEKQPGFVL